MPLISTPFPPVQVGFHALRAGSTAKAKALGSPQWCLALSSFGPSASPFSFT